MKVRKRHQMDVTVHIDIIIDYDVEPLEQGGEIKQVLSRMDNKVIELRDNHGFTHKGLGPLQAHEIKITDTVREEGQTVGYLEDDGITWITRTPKELKGDSNE